MKKSWGFSRFEFYVVVSVIGVVALFGVERYSKLAEEAQRYSVEALAQNFNAAVYNYRSRWIIDQQRDGNAIRVGDAFVQFSAQGWPLAVLSDEHPHAYTGVTKSGCESLWNAFLQNPPVLSLDNSSNSHTYRLVINSENLCRFEWTGNTSREFYFEYSPVSGEVNIHTSR